MLNQDYREMLSLLLENKVDFLLVGAYALAVHGFPRATGDIDIFVKPDHTNAKLLFKTLEEFAAPMNNITIADFEKPSVIFQIGIAPRRIDIITAIDGLTFDEASVGKMIVDIDNLKIPVISKLNLIKNKRSTGRQKDMVDVTNLEQD